MKIKNLRGDIIFDGTDLREADLQGANLRVADLQGVNLQGANLQGANLQGANLRGADLRGADLQCANLQGADLQGANLQGANLQGANLQGANLHNANLDFSSLPLRCGGLNIKINKKIAIQLLVHALQQDCDDPEFKKIRGLKIVQKFCKQFHRKEVGLWCREVVCLKD